MIKRITLMMAFTAAAIFSILASGNSTAFDPRQFTPDQKLRYAEKIIETYYVDSVEADKMVEAAIVSMLKTLDPHSLYSDPEETTELTTPLEGNFSGIGIQFNMVNDTLFVIQTTPGGPCEKVGILPGDRILEANDTIISGVKKTNADIIKTLRGPKGSHVDLKVLRRGEKEPLSFGLERDDIPVYSVDASFMADPTTGYVRITRFAEATDAELAEALKKLRKQGMKNLIIDLQDNGGGYLNAAIDVATRFLPKGSPIVYTDSPKLGETHFDAKRDGEMKDGRIVVLVNQYSASASEILSGAIQDNDRGLVVGRRTFGKGLVQRPFPFPDGSMIRLTVSRYHTPSGRCIQRPYTAGDTEDYSRDMLRRYEHGELMSADSVQFADSLRYETLHNKRPVYGGGGIMPDLFVPVDTTGYSTYYRDLVAKGVINNYALMWVDDNRDTVKKRYPTDDDFINSFTVTPEMIRGVVDLGIKREVPLDEQGLETSREVIAVILKGLVGRDIYDSETYYKAVYPELINEYKEGLRLINDPVRYNTLLNGSR